MNFQLLIKDYDTLESLKNKQIEIINIDSKETLINTTNNKGEVAFNIKENEIGDFFNINLINDDDYEQNPYFLAKESQKQITQKILTPNNYANHPAIIYFKNRISLHFNGTTLCIMKDKKILAHFSARSGKALSQEEKIKLEQQGYKNFVDSSGFMCEEINYFCLDKNWQKNDKKAIPNGEYYINSLENNARIYTNKECTNLMESSGDDFYLHFGDRFSDIDGINVANNHCDFLTFFTNQEIIKLQVEYSNKLESSIEFIFQHDDGLLKDRDYLNAAIFAPGSYIELEIQNAKDGIMQWAFVVLDDKTSVDSLFINNNFHLHFLLDKNQIPQEKYNVVIFKNDMGIDITKLGFSLPMLKDSNQKFIIVFAFEGTKPDINSPYKIIDINFKVGLDSNKSIIESKREQQNNIYNQTSINNLKAWNALQCIYNLKEAIDFLRANYQQCNKIYEKNKARYVNSNGIYNVWLDYFRIYPSLAGKIAYIYYRFDVGNEEFIKSVADDNGEYFRDRDMYIKSIVALFDKKQPYFQSKTFLQQYHEIFNTHNPANILPPNEIIEQRKHFIEYLVFKILEILKLVYPTNFTFNKNAINPYKNIVAFFKEEPKQQNGKIYLRNGYVQNQTLHFNILAIEKGNFTFASDDKYYPIKHAITFEHVLNTIFHEIRHFYIKEKYKDNDFSILKRYIYWSLRLYINDYPIIFDAFKKICDFEDSSNVGCLLKNNQNAYEPNERDSRYVSTQIIKELKKKGL